VLADQNLWFYLFVDAKSDQELALIINQISQLSIGENASPSIWPAPSLGLDAAGAAESKQYWQQHNKAPWPGTQNAPLINGSTSKFLMPDAQVSPAAPTSLLPAPPPLAEDYVADQDYREKAYIDNDVNVGHRIIVPDDETQSPQPQGCR